MYRIQSINSQTRCIRQTKLEKFDFSPNSFMFLECISSIQVINPWELISSGIGLVNYF